MKLTVTDEKGNTIDTIIADSYLIAYVESGRVRIKGDIALHVLLPYLLQFATRRKENDESKKAHT